MCEDCCVKIAVCELMAPQFVTHVQSAKSYFAKNRVSSNAMFVGAKSSQL